MGCASSKDADEVERKKGKKKGEVPFDRPGIRYIDDQMPNNQLPVSEVTPHDASLQNGTDAEALEPNGQATKGAAEVSETQVAVEVPGGEIKADIPDLHIHEEGDELETSPKNIELTADEIAKDVVASALQSAIAQEAEKEANKAATEGGNLARQTSQTVETVTRKTAEGVVETVRTETTELADGTKQTIETVVDSGSSGVDKAVSDVKDALSEIPQGFSLDTEGASTCTVTRTETTTNEEGVTEKKTTTVRESIGEDGVKETKTSTHVETVGSTMDSAIDSLVDQLRSDDDVVVTAQQEGSSVDQVVEESVQAANEVKHAPTVEESETRKAEVAEAIEEFASQLVDDAQQDSIKQLEREATEAKEGEGAIQEDLVAPAHAPPPPPLEELVTKEAGSSVDAPPQQEQIATGTHEHIEKEIIHQVDDVTKELQGDSVDAAAVPAGTPVCKYNVSVFTGDKFGAGTDANVLLSLFGAEINSGERILDNKKDNFERGKVDTFTLECPNLGPIKMMHIGHDNSGPSSGWFLDRVVVEDEAANQKYEFPCERWFAIDEDDGQCTRALWIEGADETPQAAE